MAEHAFADTDNGRKVLERLGFKQELFFGTVFDKPDSDPRLRRLYGLADGRDQSNIRYFYTINTDEAKRAYAEGWEDDPQFFECFVFPEETSANVPGTLPVYRLYNAVTADHLYTTDLKECNRAIRDNGYELESFDWRVNPALLPGAKNVLFRFGRP
jgi:hypothetical protein